MSLLVSLKNIKDEAINMAIAAFAPTLSKMLAERYQLDKIGEISELKIDRKQLKFEFLLSLKGEQDPINVKVLFRALPPNKIEIHNITASREWIEILINELIPAEKKAFEVSAEVACLLSLAQIQPSSSSK